jgi:uncharacterized protein YigA (DUF484 family)
VTPSAPQGLQGMNGITEDDIAAYLAASPGFFERHAELLGTVQLSSPHGHRAVSLQERQIELLRDKIKGLERQFMDLVRNGQENAGIHDRLQRWTRLLMQVSDAARLPDVLLDELERIFLIPQATVRIWGAAAEHAALPVATAVSEDARVFAASLRAPYCGPNTGFEAVQWLEDPAAAASIALVPLRQTDAAWGEDPARVPREEAFGLLVLASPDAARYAADMGTDVLARIGDVASAALLRLVAKPEA